MEVARSPKKLPYVPTEAEIRAFYDAVWRARRASDVILIKTLLYTGVRVSELVRIRIADVDLDSCRIRITQGKGGRDRVVPFPAGFKETGSGPSRGIETGIFIAVAAALLATTFWILSRRDA